MHIGEVRKMFRVSALLLKCGGKVRSMQEGLEGFEEVAEGKELISAVNCEDGIAFMAAAVVSDVSDSRLKGDPYDNGVCQEYLASMMRGKRR